MWWLKVERIFKSKCCLKQSLHLLVDVCQVGVFGIVCSALDATVSTLLRHGLLEDRKS